MKKILRFKQVHERIPLTYERIRQLEHQGAFPRRFKLVPGSGQQGAVGWWEHEIDEWLEAHLVDRADMQKIET